MTTSLRVELWVLALACTACVAGAGPTIAWQPASKMLTGKGGQV